MNLLHHIKERTEAITVAKFDPNDKYLAVGGIDSLIIVYSVVNKFKRQWTLRCHHFPIKKLDFSG
jgi:WD40 repeat protein